MRNNAIESLVLLIDKLGSNWLSSTLLSKVMSIYTSDKTSYINRICCLKCFIAIAQRLSSGAISETVLPIFGKAIKDK